MQFPVTCLNVTGLYQTRSSSVNCLKVLFVAQIFAQRLGFAVMLWSASWKPSSHQVWEERCFPRWTDLSFPKVDGIFIGSYVFAAIINLSSQDPSVCRRQVQPHSTSITGSRLWGSAAASNYEMKWYVSDFWLFQLTVESITNVFSPQSLKNMQRNLWMRIMCNRNVWFKHCDKFRIFSKDLPNGKKYMSQNKLCMEVCK